VSVVTVDEIVFGLSWKPNYKVSRWLDEFFVTHCQVLPVTETIARTSGGLRGLLRARGVCLTMADSLIAATAKVHGLVLVTRNTRDFEACAVPLLNPFQ